VPEIEAHDLHRLVSQQEQEHEQGLERTQIVDVRSTFEWQRGHVKGARLVPIHTFRKRLPDLGLASTRPVVVICQTAHRSVPSVRLLLQEGYNALYGAGMASTLS
jgi:rhodanese-related sulfurtransferase